MTTANNVDAISSLEGVTGVYLDRLQQPDTDTSPAFIGAPTVWSALGGQQSSGEGIIVGVLDTGVWPEHPSFSDPDPSGKAYAAPPPAPGGARDCEFNTGANPGSAFTCNNKLIGAYRFMATYDAVVGLLPNEFTSARDDNGHGTHTSSTAAGNAGVQASIFGVSRGVTSGIAPRAHVIMYKVCGDQGCFDSDSVAAIDQAIDDGVNTINFSISGGGSPYADAVELAFLNAYTQGIFVAASAGNEGPGPDTVAHRGPWVTTVAASTSNRQFVSTVTLTASNGDTISLQGASITGGINSPLPVVLASDAPYSDALCLGPAPAGTFTGKIVVCNRGPGRVVKGFNVLQGGAAGMLLRNTVFQDVLTDNHFLPTVHLNSPAGDSLIAFLSSHTGVMATFTAGAMAAGQGDVMASFSSRGGPGQSLGVSKPDVTAPGVQILAGHSPAHVDIAGGPTGELFQAIAGTSMSSPHVAGAAALLKDLHPDWTPGQIKSALMTTAKATGVVKEDASTPADAFDYGTGRIDLNLAGKPGLTFDETAANYTALANALWNANYPSFYHPALPGAIMVQRTVKDVTGRKSEWSLNAKTDKSDWKIIVPKELKVPANGPATFNITVEAGTVPLGQVRFGVVILSGPNKVKLRIPVTFVRGTAPVALAKSCDPVNLARDATTDCTITMQNTSFTDANVSMTDPLPKQMKLVQGSLTGGTLVNKSTIGFSGLLQGASPPQVSVSLEAASVSPAGGYLPLEPFGTPPIGGVGDETITNFNVPAFVYAGEQYTQLGIVSNGYLVAGGGTGADLTFNNTDLPDPAAPNNILAPFWTDLDPGTGGTLRIDLLTDNTTGESWIVVDYAAVPNYGTTDLNTFEVWIGVNGVEDITYVYGDTTNGAGNLLTVGAENRFGNSGGTVYFNGTGTLPSTFAPAQAVLVTSIPGNPGAVQTVTFQLKADKKGKWQNCANLTADIFQGVAITCINGNVTK